MKILLCCFLLYQFGICESAILPSNDLQKEISFEFLTPADLLKVGLVDKDWISVEMIFKKIGGVPGIELFLHKEKNEIIFQTTPISVEFVEIARVCSCIIGQIVNQEEDPTQLLYRLVLATANFLNFKDQITNGYFRDVMKGLAEIIDIEANSFPKIQFSYLFWNFPEATLTLINRGYEWGANENKPLHIVSHMYSSVDSDVLEALLNKRDQIDARDDRGRTPLMLAALLLDHKAMKMLLAHEADPSSKCRIGKTALDYLENCWRSRALGYEKDFKECRKLLSTAVPTPSPKTDSPPSPKKSIIEKFNAFRDNFVLFFHNIIEV